jgi:ketosteroid isomerase-like protein
MADQAGSTDSESTIEDEREIRRINSEWVDALVRGDAATLNNVMDEHCIFSYALEGDDKAQFLADIEAGEVRVDLLKREQVEVRVYGPTGVLTALDTADWLYRGHRIQGFYRTIHVYTNTGSGWKIVAIQASPISST